MSDVSKIPPDELWRDIYAIADPRAESLEGGNPLADQALRMLWYFYVAFQTLVLVLAIAVLCGLIIAIIQFSNGDTATGIVTGIGAVVSGAGSSFLQARAHAALKEYRIAESARNAALSA